MEIGCLNSMGSIGAGTGGYVPEKVLEIMQDETRRSEYEGEVRIVRFR